MLATLVQLKRWLNVSGAGDDTLLTELLRRTSSRIARECGRVHAARPCLEKLSQIEFFSPAPRAHLLWLSAYPVCEITEIKEALYGEWSAATALVVNTDYLIHLPTGELIRVGWWLAGDRCVRVTYPGGYTPCEPWVTGSAYAIGDVVSYAEAVYTCTDTLESSTTAPPDDEDHWEVATGEVPLPDDLAEAALLQAAYWWQRRNKLGVMSSGAAGGSASASTADDLLPAVRETCGRYRRLLG